ncbi:phosphoribosylamine--glycine ligase [Ricinus communis]|uniref:Phosphoribosylamine--glycine ligase n=1 Tax=Ricinus communis TaxID=3988 RepID=B9SKB7_RICCO|nr:phosphoribosylamine--glycine ligase [Ricinus communis]
MVAYDLNMFVAEKFRFGNAVWRLVVLLIGGGGREHALCYALQQSPSCDAVFCAAGNVGISNSGNATCIPDLDIFDSSAVISFCHKWGVGLVVVGPEAPLVAGLANDLVKLSGGMSKQNAPSFDKNVTSSTIKQRQQHEASGRIIRNILLNKDSRQNQSSRVQSEQQIQSSNLEKEKRLQRPPRGQLVLKDVNGSSDDKFVGNDLHGFSGEKQEKLTRNKDGLLFVGQMSHMQALLGKPERKVGVDVSDAVLGGFEEIPILVKDDRGMLGQLSREQHVNVDGEMECDLSVNDD